MAESQKLPYVAMEIKSPDGTRLKARYFESVALRAAHPEWSHFKGPPRGLIVQYHGNAQNMTVHFMNEAWLLFEGFDLLIFDYRGYGDSEGAISLQGIYEDSQEALRFAATEAKKRNLPLIAYAQSLGGSLLLRVLEDEPLPPELKLVVIESSFYSYKQIAREKLADIWFLWPLQWLAYILVTDEYSPGSEKLAKISPTPVFLMYSEHDPVVPFNHGEQIFKELHDPKEFLRHPNPGHINTMYVEDGKYRTVLLEQIAKAIK